TSGFENFKVGTDDSDAFSITLPSTNDARWIDGLETLCVGTSGDEWRIMSSKLDSPITPTNFTMKQQTTYGSDTIQPTKVNDVILYTDMVSRRVREFTFSDSLQKYTSPDLTALAEHITEGGITSVAYQKNPDPILWGTRGGRMLLSQTYEREQNVVAWSKHPMGWTEIDSSEVDWDTSAVADGYYPTLRELTASEIPTKPSAPTIADGTTTVSDATELQAMNGANSYILDSNSDLSDVTWTPITGFSGTLDGDGHTISNLEISSVSASQQGLFGTVGDGFKCKDVNFNNCSISTTSSRSDVGILVGLSTGTDVAILLSNIHLTNCSVSMEDGSDSVGILCGNLEDIDELEIYNCSATDCSVTGAFQVGGLIGVIKTKTGPTNEMYITDCFVENLTMANTEGYPQWDTAYQMGGFIALPYNRGVGVGEPFINFHSCYSTGTITVDGGFDIGGFCSSTGGNFRFISCYSDVDIVVDMIDTWVGYDLSVVGGFTAVDTCYDIYIDCHSAGDITVTNATEYDTNLIGGFCGLTAFTEITSYLRCYSAGNISITSTHSDSQANGIGGFIGELRSWAYVTGADVNSIDTITRCWSESDISISVPTANYAYQIGGFIGTVVISKSSSYVESAEIKNCYTWSDIDIENSAEKVGGFIGLVTIQSQDSLTIDNCYIAQTDTKYGSGVTDNISRLTGSDINAHIGLISGTGNSTATDTFWDIETSGITTTPENGAAGQETSWMMQPDNYTDAGWDLDTIWDLSVISVINYIQMDAEGEVSSVAVIPGMPDIKEDEVWCAVLRNVGGTPTRFIERMWPRVFPTQSDCRFVDCGVFYDGEPATVISGLSHLNGQPVSILADGAVFDDQTVTDGAITLPKAASKVAVGLPYRYRLQPMRIDVSAGKGGSHTMVKKIGRFFISFFKTLGSRYGIENNMYDINWRNEEDYDSPPALFTGEKDLNFDGGFSPDDPILITGEKPLPCTIRAIIVDTDFVD
ncbi:MAG: hypothetical protein DRJ03_29655, partial [Chloroflexi bacterium]